MRYKTAVDADSFINAAISKGAALGLEGLLPKERAVFLISELEVCCDIDGIDSFLDRYPETVLECAHLFEALGALELSQAFADVAKRMPTPPDDLLDGVNDLVTSRHGYDYESIVQWIQAGGLHQ